MAHVPGTFDPIVTQLKNFRLEAGMSIAKVGRLSGVHPSTLSGIERGLHSVTLPSLRAWALALGHNLELVEADYKALEQKE